MENIWFEIRKILDIDGIINFGDGHNITTFIHSLCYFCRFLQKCPNLHWRRRLLKHKILDFWKLCSQTFFWMKKLWLTFLARFIWTVYCLTLIYRIFRQNYFRWYREVCYKTYTEIRNKTFRILIIYRLVYRAVILSQCLK